ETFDVGFAAHCVLTESRLGLLDTPKPEFSTGKAGYATVFGKPIWRNGQGRRLIEVLFGEEFEIKMENAESMLTITPTTRDMAVKIYLGRAHVFFAADNVTVVSLRDYRLYFCRFVSDREQKHSPLMFQSAQLISRDPYFNFSQDVSTAWKE